MKIDMNKLEIAKARACMTTKDILKQGIASGTYNNVSVGKSVSPLTVGKIAKALGVDVTEIIED